MDSFYLPRASASSSKPLTSGISTESKIKSAGLAHHARIQDREPNRELRFQDFSNLQDAETFGDLDSLNSDDTGSFPQFSRDHLSPLQSSSDSDLLSLNPSTPSSSSESSPQFASYPDSVSFCSALESASPPYPSWSSYENARPEDNELVPVSHPPSWNINQEAQEPRRSPQRSQAGLRVSDVNTAADRYALPRMKKPPQELSWRSSSSSSTSQKPSRPADRPTVLEESKKKTELCRTWVKTRSCSYGDSCCYAHGDDELASRKRNESYKTVPCSDCCREEFGFKCTYGSRCNYVHPGESLRRPWGSVPYADEDYMAALKKDYPYNLHPFGIFV